VSPTRDQVRAAIHDAGLSNLASDAAADAGMALVESLSCPHVVTGDEGTSYCQLAATQPRLSDFEQDVVRKAAVRVTEDCDDIDRVLMVGLLMIIDRFCPQGGDTDGEAPDA
jgi:hypothetical protein